MVTPLVEASIDPALALVLSQEARFAENIYEENPVGVFRGLAFAMLFNVILALSGVAGWELWRLLR